MDQIPRNQEIVARIHLRHISDTSLDILQRMENRPYSVNIRHG